jgi:endonuclease/exonuclease/phosphatase family metal-dependent hydrolase
MTAATLRVLTWNVHSCIGADRRLDPDRVRDHIRAIAPDIAALQEVDSRRDRRDGFDLLGDCLGGHSAEVRTVRTPDGDYGHMLLSRWPITAWREHDITFGSREPRSMIEATVESDLGRINVLCTHLGLSRRERRQQALKIEALAEADNRPTVVMGDFNEPTGSGPVGRLLARTFSSAGRRATWPSVRPLFPLDRIFFEPSLSLVRADVERGARLASDHLPLWADLRR